MAGILSLSGARADAMRVAAQVGQIFQPCDLSCSLRYCTVAVLEVFYVINGMPGMETGKELFVIKLKDKK